MNINSNITLIQKALLYKYNIKVVINKYQVYSEKIQNYIEIKEVKIGKKVIAKTTKNLEILRVLLQLLEEQKQQEEDIKDE